MDEQQQEQGGGDPIGKMVMMVDQAIGQLAQVLGQQQPEAGEALAQVGAQFRAVIEGIAGGSASSKAAPEMVDPNSRGQKSAQQAYM